MNDIGLNGRLGNQMFQYASLMGIAKKNNFEYGINYENDFNLDLSDIPEDIHINQKILTLSRLFKLSALNSNNLNYPTIIEPHMHFCEDLFKISDNTNLHGYFQTEKYFSHIKNQIINEYKFPNEIKEKAELYIKSIKDREVVGVHFRRSDYIALKDFYNTNLEDYYKKAFDIFSANKYIFLLFSDDLEFLHQNFSDKNNFKICDIKNQFIELSLMTMCDHNIIANSSFSWWGAWLNQNQNKKVIAPSVWFNHGYKDKDTKDIYCDGWIKL
jgi:hypothetical protein